LDEAANEIADMGVTSVARVRIRDDEGSKVRFGRSGALRFAHARSRESLVAVRRQQSAHDRSGLVRHLGEGVTREIRAWIFGHGALGRGGPSSEIDGLDARAL